MGADLRRFNERAGVDDTLLASNSQSNPPAVVGLKIISNSVRGKTHFE